MTNVTDPGQAPTARPEPSPLDTAEFSYEEILQRLELGRLMVKNTEDGSRLEVAHVNAPEGEQRTSLDSEEDSDRDRRRFRPLDIPILFPEKGPILVLIVGGFADENALNRPIPFWGDDTNGACLLWQAMAQAGLLHKKDAAFSLGQGGVWNEHPPRTMGLAMTYMGFRWRNEIAGFDRTIHPWNIHRLQTLVQACWERSMNRLKVITVGEPARFMMCACVYGMSDIPVLSLPEPTPKVLSHSPSHDSAEANWVEWASDLMMADRIPEP